MTLQERLKSVNLPAEDVEFDGTYYTAKQTGYDLPRGPSTMSDRIVRLGGRCIAAGMEGNTAYVTFSLDAPADDAPMTEDERAEFERLDKIVLDGAKTFVNVGLALGEIKHRKLYREFGTWDVYSQTRLGKHRSYANRLIAAAQLVESVPNGAVIQNEGQARALGEFPQRYRETILDTTLARYDGKLTDSNIRRVGELVTTMARTGHVETDDGKQTPIDAALDLEDYEAAQRRKEHQQSNNLYYAKAVPAKVGQGMIVAGEALYNELMNAGAGLGEEVFVSVWVKRKDR